MNVICSPYIKKTDLGARVINNAWINKFKILRFGEGSARCFPYNAACIRCSVAIEAVAINSGPGSKSNTSRDIHLS